MHSKRKFWWVAPDRIILMGLQNLSLKWTVSQKESKKWQAWHNYYTWADSNIHDFLTIFYISVDEFRISSNARSPCTRDKVFFILSLPECKVTFSFVLLCHSAVSEQCRGWFVALRRCHRPGCSRGAREVLPWCLLWEALQLSSTHGGCFYRSVSVLRSSLFFFSLAVALRTCKLYCPFRGLLLLGKPWCWVGDVRDMTGCHGNRPWYHKRPVMNPFQGHTRKNSCIVLQKVLTPELLSSTSKENRENDWQNKCPVLPPLLVWLSRSLFKSSTAPVWEH